jgi:hypothetical protein
MYNMKTAGPAKTDGLPVTPSESAPDHPWPQAESFFPQQDLPEDCPAKREQKRVAYLPKRTISTRINVVIGISRLLWRVALRISKRRKETINILIIEDDPHRGRTQRE